MHTVRDLLGLEPVKLHQDYCRSNHQQRSQEQLLRSSRRRLLLPEDLLTGRRKGQCVPLGYAAARSWTVTSPSRSTPAASAASAGARSSTAVVARAGEASCARCGSLAWAQNGASGCFAEVVAPNRPQAVRITQRCWIVVGIGITMHLLRIGVVHDRVHGNESPDRCIIGAGSQLRESR